MESCVLYIFITKSAEQISDPKMCGWTLATEISGRSQYHHKHVCEVVNNTKYSMFITFVIMAIMWIM